MRKILSKKGIIIVFITLCVSLIILFSNRYTDVKITNLYNNAEAYNNQKVELVGFMSPLISKNENYFYLMETPYNIKASDYGVPIFIKVTEDMRVVYTDKPITVKGELIWNEQGYIDSNSVKRECRIINASFYEIDLPEFEQYCQLAETGLFEDIVMYYGLFDALKSVDKSDIEQIDSELFQNMILLLAVTGITDEELAKIINEEAELAEHINSQISNGVYSFTDIELRLKQLEEMIESYFRKYTVEVIYES